MSLDLEPTRRWWAQRNLRERWMVLGGGIAALLLAADTLVALPLDKRVRREQADMQTLTARIEQLRLKAVAPPPPQPPAGAATEAQLHQRLQAAQAAATAQRQRAGDATRLPETLRAITATVGSLRLLALDLGGDAAPAGATVTAAAATAAVPAIAPLAAVADAAAAATGQPPRAGRLYRLPITLKVSGSYDELQLLLNQIERHADNLQWATLTLERGDWPAIQLTFKAHVLSAEPRWGATS